MNDESNEDDDTRHVFPLVVECVGAAELTDGERVVSMTLNGEEFVADIPTARALVVATLHALAELVGDSVALEILRLQLEGEQTVKILLPGDVS